MKKWVFIIIWLMQITPAVASDPLALTLPAARLCLYSRIGPVLQSVIEEQTASRAVDAPVPLVSAAYSAGVNWGTSWTRAIQQKAGKKTSKKAPDLTENKPSRMITTLAFLREHFRFVPDSVWLYVRNSSEYLIVVSGDVVPENWRCLFSPERLINRGKGFSVGSQLQNSRENPVLLHVAPGYLLVFPANLEGTVLDSLAGHQEPGNDKWATFAKMVGLQPLLALEIDTTETSGSASLLGSPFPLSEVQRFRCLIGRDLTKLQAFLVHDDARTLLLSQVIDVLRELANPDEVAKANINTASLHENPLPAYLAALKAKIQGQSVFLEGPGLRQNQSLAAAAAIGVIDSLLSRHLPADLVPILPDSRL